MKLLEGEEGYGDELAIWAKRLRPSLGLLLHPVVAFICTATSREAAAAAAAGAAEEAQWDSRVNF